MSQFIIIYVANVWFLFSVYTSVHHLFSVYMSILKSMHILSNRICLKLPKERGKFIIWKTVSASSQISSILYKYLCQIIKNHQELVLGVNFMHKVNHFLVFHCAMSNCAIAFVASSSLVLNKLSNGKSDLWPRLVKLAMRMGISRIIDGFDVSQNPNKGLFSLLESIWGREPASWPSQLVISTGVHLRCG